MASSNSNDSHDEFTDTHSEGSNEEELTTTYTVNKLDTHDCHYGIDYISDNSGGKKKVRHRDFGCQRKVYRLNDKSVGDPCLLEEGLYVRYKYRLSVYGLVRELTVP